VIGNAGEVYTGITDHWTISENRPIPLITKVLPNYDFLFLWVKVNAFISYPLTLDAVCTVSSAGAFRGERTPTLTDNKALPWSSLTNTCTNVPLPVVTSPERTVTPVALGTWDRSRIS